MSFSHAGGENRSFVLAVPRTYIACMTNRYPTSKELYALEREARRLRAEEIARLSRALGHSIKGLFAVKVKGLRHA